MIKFTNQNVEIKDTLYGFSYTSGIAQSNFFYNNTSIVFCNEYNAQPRKALLYKNGKLVELAQSKDVKLLYADTNLDRIIFITKDDSASDFANLYMYENGEVNLICSRVNDRKFEFFVINNINDVIMTYLAESKNKSAARIPLWDLFASDLHDTPKLIENDIKDYSAFLTEKNKIKYIIRKWSNIKAKHYAGYFDEDFDWLVIKTDKKSKKFPMGNIGDRFISLQGKLVLLKTVETVHDDDYFLKRKIVYSLSLVNTETFEQVFIEKTHDSQKFRFTNYLYFAGEFIDLDHTTRLGININSDLIEKYPNYFKSGSAKKHEYPYITFFSKTNSKKYYIAMELAKKAKKFEVVDSPYSLDDSQNYIVYYDQASEFGIMEAFLGSMVHLSSSIKFRIFGIDIFDLIRCCSGKFYRSVNDDLEYYQ